MPRYGSSGLCSHLDPEPDRRKVRARVLRGLSPNRPRAISARYVSALRLATEESNTCQDKQFDPPFNCTRCGNLPPPCHSVILLRRVQPPSHFA